MSLELPTSPTSNGPTSADRAVKKRASQACHHCRERKVKCDLVKSGIPCHNCSSDGIECVILESKRSRKYRLQKRQLTRLVSLPPISQAQPKPNLEPSFPKQQSNSSDDSTATQDFTAQVHQTTIAPAAPRTLSIDSRQAGPIVPPVIPSTFHSPSAITPNTSVGTQSRVRAPSSVSTRGQSFELPAYIRPSRPDVRQDDLEFLGRRGALSLPVGELRDELIRCFVLYVHPFMPIVDLEDFMGAISGNDSASKISLIVFQAVLFSATAYVDLPLLQEAGYDNRRAGRADYYQKVKVSRSTSISPSLAKQKLMTPAALRFRLGCGSHRSHSIAADAQLLVCVRERPKGPLALAWDLRLSCY